MMRAYQPCAVQVLLLLLELLVKPLGCLAHRRLRTARPRL